ncbi:hypothetical protein ACFL46_06290 [Candidatus Neomarinimicrobiota bacterium]
MREVVIQIPTIEAEQNIDIDVKINGRKKSLKYRVEIVDYENVESVEDDRVSVLKHVIKDHEKDWELIQIGAPLKKNIPIMFRKRNN